MDRIFEGDTTMAEGKGINGWKIEGNRGISDVKSFTDFVEWHARTMEVYGWLCEASHLRRWIPELRNSCDDSSASRDNFITSFH